MLIKLLGSATLLVSALYCSVQLIRNANRKIAQLTGLCALIRYIKINIDSFMEPIGEILASFREYGESLTPFMDTVRRDGLTAGVNHGELAVDGEARQILLDFSEKIGRGYKEDELALCTYTLKELEAILNREKADTERKMKMYKTLPLMSALSLVLILM